MKALKLMLAGLIIAGGSTWAIAPAWAACKPPCKGGDVCRYEAAGDKFYCKPPPTPVGKVDGASTTKPQQPVDLGKPKQILQK